MSYKVSERNVCYTSVPQEGLLQEFQKLFECLFSSTCLHSGSWFHLVLACEVILRTACARSFGIWFLGLLELLSLDDRAWGGHGSNMRETRSECINHYGSWIAKRKEPSDTPHEFPHSEKPSKKQDKLLFLLQSFDWFTIQSTARHLTLLRAKAQALLPG